MSHTLVFASLLWLSGCSGISAYSAESQSGPPHCPATVTVKLDGVKRNFTVEYVEPSTQLKRSNDPNTSSEPLHTLSHTTIYLERANGVREYTKVAASSVAGGGHVQRIVTPPDPKNPELIKVCVTASNAVGEGPPTP